MRTYYISLLYCKRHPKSFEEFKDAEREQAARAKAEE